MPVTGIPAASRSSSAPRRTARWALPLICLWYPSLRFHLECLRFHIGPKVQLGLWSGSGSGSASASASGSRSRSRSRSKLPLKAPLETPLAMENAQREISPWHQRVWSGNATDISLLTLKIRLPFLLSPTPLAFVIHPQPQVSFHVVLLLLLHPP